MLRREIALVKAINTLRLIRLVVIVRSSVKLVSKKQLLGLKALYNSVRLASLGITMMLRWALVRVVVLI